MYISNIYQKKSFTKRMQQLWHDIHHNISLVIGLYGICMLLILMIADNTFVPFPQNLAHFTKPLLPPAWSDQGNIAYFLGTDDRGRDILSRLIYGIYPSFGSSMLIMAIVSLIGCFFGVISGISHGLCAAFLTYIFDIFLVIPSLLVILAMVVFIGPSLHTVILSVLLVLLPQTIRIIQHAVHNELKKEYVTAIRLEGASIWYILKIAVIPNITPEIVRVCRQNWTAGIMYITTFGFLGLGAQPPSNEWGCILHDALDMMYSSPWIVIFPGMAIIITILFIYLLGDGIQQLLSRQG